MNEKKQGGERGWPLGTGMAEDKRRGEKIKEEKSRAEQKREKRQTQRWRQRVRKIDGRVGQSPFKR